MNQEIGDLVIDFFSQYVVDSKQPGSNITILKHRDTGILVLMKEIHLEHKADHEDAIQSLNFEKELYNEHLMSLNDFFVRENKGQYQLLLFYEYEKIPLSKEIYLRRVESRTFSEQQLWNLLLSIVCGAAYLQENDIGHGCISPEDIFISQEGTVKLVDPTLASANPFQCQENYYYSPQLLKILRKNQLPASFNIYKSDVFSLALCLLEVALLNPILQCIDYQHYQIIEKNLFYMLQRVEQQYSQKFTKILILMLQYKQQDRPDFIELRDKIIGIITESVSRISFNTQNIQTIHRTQSNSENRSHLFFQSIKILQSIQNNSRHDTQKPISLTNEFNLFLQDVTNKTHMTKGLGSDYSTIPNSNLNCLHHSKNVKVQQKYEIKHTQIQKQNVNKTEDGHKQFLRSESHSRLNRQIDNPQINSRHKRRATCQITAKFSGEHRLSIQKIDVNQQQIYTNADFLKELRIQCNQILQKRSNNTTSSIDLW